MSTGASSSQSALRRGAGRTHRRGGGSAPLFPTLDVVIQQSGESERLWDKYCELRPQLIDLEASLSGRMAVAGTDVSAPLRKSARRSD